MIECDRPRSDWPLGKILTLHCSHDGVVRSVKLKTRHGVTTRPIIKLIKLEVLPNYELKVNDEISNVERTNNRPQRKAAIAAKELIAQSYLD